MVGGLTAAGPGPAGPGDSVSVSITPGTSASFEGGPSTVRHGFALHVGGLTPEQGLVVWF